MKQHGIRVKLKHELLSPQKEAKY